MKPYLMTLASILLAITVISTPVLAAKVYKYTDENGNTVFTDVPREDAEELEVQPVTTIPAIPVPKTTSQPQKKAFSYESVSIIAPENEANFINNEGTVTVTVSIKPRLRSSDQLQLMFNGSAYGPPQSSTSFPLTNLDRGAYQTQVNVVDRDGKTLVTSDSITFFVKRATAPRKQPKNP